MDQTSRSFITCLVVFSIIFIVPQFSEASNIELFNAEIDDDHFFNQLANGRVTKTAVLSWSLYPDPDSTVYVTVYLGRDDSGWEPLLRDLKDVSEVLIDPIELEIENGEGYSLRIVATTMDGRYGEDILDGKFSVDVQRGINISVESKTDPEGVIGPLEIEWTITGKYVKPVNFDLTVLYGCEIVEDADITMNGDTGATINTFNLDQIGIYRISLTAVDSMGEIATFTGLDFTVGDFRIPELIGIEEEDMIWEPLRISFVPSPNPDAWHLFETDVYFRKIGTDERIYIFRDVRSKKEVEWEPSRFEQGRYSMIQVSKGNADGIQYSDMVNFTICDGTLPMIVEAFSPARVIDEYMELIYKVHIEGPSGFDMIRTNVSYMDRERNWVEISPGFEYSGNTNVYTGNIPSGTYIFKITSYNIIHRDFSSDYYLKDIEIVHNDPPHLILEDCPGNNISDIVNLSWYSVDMNNDEIFVDIFFNQNGGEWLYLDTVKGGGSRSYTWNVSKMKAGSYSIMIIAKENTVEGLFSKEYTQAFNITGGGENIDLKDSSDSKLVTGISLISVFIVTLLLISSFVVFIKVRSKRKVMNAIIYPGEVKPPRFEIFDLKKALPPFGCTSEPVEHSNGNRAPQKGSVEDLIDILGCGGDDELREEDIESYRILGLPMNATEDQIRNRYMDFVRRYHPDRFARISEDLRKKAEVELSRKNRAKEILLNHQKRAVLDSMIREGNHIRIRESSIRKF